MLAGRKQNKLRVPAPALPLRSSGIPVPELFLILGPVPILILKLVRVLVFDSMVLGS